LHETLDKAEQFFERACLRILAASKETRDFHLSPIQACNAYHNLGNAQQAVGDDTRALGAHQQELQIARGANDKLLECRALHCIGRVKLVMGIDSRAKHSAHLQRAIEMHNLAEQGVAKGGIGCSLRLVNSSDSLEAHD